MSLGVYPSKRISSLLDWTWEVTVLLGIGRAWALNEAGDGMLNVAPLTALSIVFMSVRVGNAAGMVVRHRVHLVLRRDHSEHLWERTCHHHLESQLWNRLLVWLDYDRALWSARGTWGHELSLHLHSDRSTWNPCLYSFFASEFPDNCQLLIAFNVFGWLHCTN